MKPRVYSSVGLAALLCLILTDSVAAGPNAGGTLVVHATPYRGRSGDPFCEAFDLVNCEDAVVSVPERAALSIWHIAVAFPAGSRPRLSGLIFGVEYDESTVFLTDSGPCGPDFELPSESWPGSGSGTALTWSVPQTDTLVPIYAIAGYEYYGNDTQFCLTPHPNGGGVFADDSVPAILDEIADYSCMGFGTDPGYLACPRPLEVAACCLQNGTCEMITELECEDLGGNWMGSGTDCVGAPCAVPVTKGSWGEIKARFR